MIDKIERKIGKHAIKNLIYYVLGGYVIGYILLLSNSKLGLYNYITLDPAMVMKGQVWRLFTWVCTAPQSFSFFVIFMFLLYFFIGRSLEQNLGAFKYNLYMFSGWFFTTLGAMAVYWITKGIYGSYGAISMNVSTYYINLASFLAFAVLFPDVKIYFFGILPIKIKWLAIIDIVYLGFTVVTSVISLIGLPNQMVQQVLSSYGIETSYAKVTIITEVFSIIISLLNFIIFFIATRNFKKLSFKEIKRKRDFKQNYSQGYNQNRTYNQSNQTSQNSYNNQQSSTQQRTGFTGFGRGSAGHNKDTSKYNNTGNMLVHRCSICGRTNITNPELTFRYCSKCEGNHEYCQDHLFTHMHVKN